MTTEELKFEMYEKLAALREARKHPLMLRNFEDDLEAYLEALRKEYERAVMIGGEAIEYKAIMRDGYDRQCQLTHSACVSYRELEDECRELRTDKQHLENTNEQGYAKLQEATAKLAQQAQTIMALHRVVKDQQIAQDRLQGLVEIAVHDRNRQQAESYSEAALAQAEIMRLEGVQSGHLHKIDAITSKAASWEQSFYDLKEVFKRSEKSMNEFIASQRATIRNLEFQRDSALELAEKRTFWRFLMPKKNKAKPLPEKIN